MSGPDFAEYAVAKSSILSPGDARGAMTVGAIHYNDYDLGRIADYSSRGPTTDGRIKPDLVAPMEYRPFLMVPVPFGGLPRRLPTWLARQR